ncbi:MAG: NFACT family protein [Clostridia bacterium]|nr:NFACT family protein [Clostridia bacterium]
MAYDGIFIAALTADLKKRLIGGKIDKIHQPEPDSLLIQMHCGKERYKLYITANSSLPFISLTENKFENPLSPPMFCMLLRKHISNGTIIDVEQRSQERVVTFKIEARNELGELVLYHLIVEIMGKHSNIILTVADDNKIIDSIHRVSMYQSRIRQILPGLTFDYLPSNKLNLLSLTNDQFSRLIGELLDSNKDLEIVKFLYTTYEGFSPNLARDVIFQSGLDLKSRLSELRPQEIDQLFESVNRIKSTMENEAYTPCTIQEKETGKYIDLTAIHPALYSPELYTITESDVISVINDYYKRKDVVNRFLQKSQSMRKMVSQRIEKGTHKLSNLQSDLIFAENADDYKIKGELVLANLYQIEKGMNAVIVDNYYTDPCEKIELQLDIRLSPADNAQKFFKKYNKLKTAQTEIVKQIEETTDEIAYLEQVLNNLENTTDNANLEEIKMELVKAGILKARKEQMQRQKLKSAPYHYRSEEGFDILVGKNNLQNDQLTLKTASKSDMWLHTKDIPGSHVIIRAEGHDIPDETLLLAAKLAAFHSKGKSSSQVPVDYTQVRNVNKPSGAKPGMVIYVKNHTLYVTPDADELEKYMIQ